MTDVTLRRPSVEDGPKIHTLVAACPPLDRNSLYCNLLQVTHFRETAVVAERAGEVLGCITGYRVPGRPRVLFVWQVAVAEAGRGQGLAGRMLDHLLERLPDIDHLETTVTPDNAASAALFQRFAARHGAGVERTVLFERDRDFAGAHADEVLFRIGPLAANVQQETHAA